MLKNIVTKLFSRLAAARLLALPTLLLYVMGLSTAYAHNTITGSVSPQVVAPGGTVTYSFVSDAAGTSADIIGLQITHALPAGFTYVSGSCSQLNTHSTRTSILNPAPGATSPVFGTWTQTAAGLGVPAGVTSCSYVVQVPAAAPSSCTPLTSNITKTSGSAHTDINVVAGVGVIVSAGGSPVLGVSKTTSTPLSSSGGTATYTIVFNNTGPGGSCPATNVIVKDTLPTGFTFASTGAVVLGGGATRPTITNPAAGAAAPAWGSFSLPAGASVSLTFTANIAISDAPKYYQNNVSLTSDAGGATSGPTAAVAVTAKPAITKSFTPAFIATNATSNMRFTLSNASPNISAVSGLAFTDTLPAGVTAVNGTTAVCGGSLTITGGNALSFSGGTLAAGFSCNIDVTVTGTTPGVKPNTTSVLSSNLGAGFASNTATLTVSNTPSIAKAFAPTSIASGGTSALTFTIGNTNTTPLNNVTFTDTLINMEIASTAITGSCAVVSNSPALTVGATALNILIPGVPTGGCTVTVQVTSTIAGSNPNTASGVTSTQTPVASAPSNTANLTVGVTPPPAPSVTKYFTPSVVQRNNGSSTSVLSIAITNPLSTAISGVAFTDTYPTTPNTGLINANTTTTISPTGCTGSLTAVNNGTNLVLTGGFVPALTTCIYTANIKTKSTKANSVGTYTNSTGVISYNDGAAKTLAATSATFQVVSGNGVSIGKAFSPSTIPAGSTSQLTITLSARGFNATAAAFTDTLPAGVTVAAAPTNGCGGTATAVAGSNVVSLTGGAIAADTSCNIVVSVFAPSVGSYINTLPIGALSVLNGTTVVKSTVAASATLTVVAPVLTIAKSTSTPSVINTAGTTATYTITVNNLSGSATFTGVSINDVLPAGFTFASNSAPVLAGTATRTATVNPAVGATSPTWGTFSVPPASSVAITFVADVGSSVPTGTYSNSATVTSTGTAATTNSFIGANNTSDDVSVTTPTRILNVNKTTSTPSLVNTSAGTVATYTITVNNSGNSTATGVAINDVLPVGFTYASNTAPVLAGGATRTGIVNPAVGATAPTWGTFSIPAGDSVAITFNANVASTVTAGVYDNSASIAAGSNASTINNYDGTLSTNTAEDVSISTALLVVSKVSNTPVVNLVAGAGTANYTITVKNNGSAAATGVIVTDTLPSTAPNVFSYSATSSVTLGGSPVTFTAAGSASAPTWDSAPTGGFTIAPGASLVISFSATLPITVVDGTYNNSASAIGAAASISNFNGAASTLDDVIVTHATLTVDKTTSTPVITNTPAGTTATYTITVKNSGSGPTSAMTVTDTLPAGFTFASTSSLTLNGSAVAFTAPTAAATAPVWNSSPTGGFIIAAGQSLVITFVANVASTVVDGTYDNSASTSIGTSFNYNGATQNGENVTVNSATLEVSKVADTPIIANTLAGTTATYSITVSNTGGGTATNVSINDALTVAGVGFTYASTSAIVYSGGATGVVTNPTAGATTPAWSTFTIPPLGSVTITFVANVASSVVNGTYNNSANALSASVKTANITNFNGSAPGTTVDDVTVTSAILTVSKTTSTPTVTKGGTGAVATYTITIANTGNGAATGITITDTLPAGFTYGSTGSIVVGGVPVTAFTVGGTAAIPVWDSNPAGGFTIEDGQSLVLTFDAAIAGTVVDGTYQNSASAAGGAKAITNYAAASSTAEDVVITNVPEFTLTKTHVDPFPIGVPGVYTFTVKNIGVGATASSTGVITVTDTLPAGLTYVSNTAGANIWACVSTPPVVTCTSASFTLAAGATSTFTMTVAVAGPAANVVNTADVTTSSLTTLLPAASTLDPTTIGALPGVNVSGFVYSDANHNIQIDSGEAGTGLTLFAKLVPSATPAGPALQAVTVNTATGAYTFPTVAPGTYIIVIDDNNTLADVTPTIAATWLGTEMPTQTRNNVAVAATDLVNLNFGLFNGNTLTGRVFVDNGIGVGGVANDGLLNGTEIGLAATVVKLTNAAGITTFDSTVTDASGNYTLWIPNAQATASLKVVETNLGGYISTGGSVGNTAGVYARATDTTTFTFAAGTNYTLVNFADVPVNTLVANGQQSALPGNVVFYTHTFTAGSGGSVTFSSTSPAGWPQALYLDTNCNGVINTGEVIITVTFAVTAGSKTCVILKETIPNGTALNAQDSATVVANFTYTNAAPALTASLFNTDLTTLGSAGLVLSKSQSTATPLPGSNIIYTISYTNSSNAPLSTIIINDATLSFTTFVSASCVLPLPAAISACSVTTQPAVGATGSIKWTLTGSLQPAATGQVQFTIKVD